MLTWHHIHDNPTCFILHRLYYPHSRQRKYLEKQVLAARAQKSEETASTRASEAERQKHGLLAFGGDSKCMWKIDEVEEAVDDRPEPRYGELVVLDLIFSQASHMARFC